MRIATIPDNWLERLAIWLGIAPTPVLDTFHAVAVARSIMVATKLGVFEAMDVEQKTSTAVAAQLQADAEAVEKLLNVLVSARYLKSTPPHYALTRQSRRWLLRDSPVSLRDNVLFRFMEWEAIERLEDYVRTGQHLDVHDQLDGQQWNVYQRGMRSIAGMSAAEVARRVKLPRSATNLLDIGGSHGFYSVSFCRRHPKLQATVLDLPAAVEHAAPILARENMGDRVQHRVGDALAEDLGESEWDVVFVSHLIHHLDAVANRSLVARAARGLTRDGILAILDAPRVPAADKASQTATLLDLFFAMTSNAGCWSSSEIVLWLRAAGLQVQPPISLRTAPGLVVYVAHK